MSGLKLTVKEGLTAQGEGDVWEGFYNEEEPKEEKEAKKKRGLTAEEGDVWEEFYSEEEHKEQQEAKKKQVDSKGEGESHFTAGESEEKNDRSDSSNAGEEQDGEVIDSSAPAETTNEANSLSEEKHPKKSKAKKVKSHKHRSTSPRHIRSHKPRERSPPAQHSSSHNQGSNRPRGPLFQQHSSHDQDNNRQHGRKLERRLQMRNENLSEQVEQAGRERLEQKYEELEELMTRPLADTRGRTSGRRLHKMVNLRHQHAQNGYREHGTGGGEDHQAYSTIRTLQTGGRNVRLKIIYSSRSTRSALSPRSAVPKSSTPQHSSRGSVDSPVTSSSGRLHSKNKADFSTKENGFGDYSSDEDHSGSSDEDNGGQKAYMSVNSFLRHTDNPKLREWVKRKDAEYRRARKAERKKKREERNDKMVEDELKIARREKSSERVKEWMQVKRREVALRQKAERRRIRQEAEEQKKRAKSQESVLRGTRIDRPRTAPTQRSSYVLIKRPNSAARLDEGDGSTSKPPDTKFVYKRRVTGRVQLMKFQNERNARARSADEQRCDELSAEDRQQKAKTSYDAWLLSKKKEAVEKKKEAKKQKEAMRSDPEMERIIPEMAQRRIERVKNGKKTLDTGLHGSSAGGEERETQEGDSQEREESAGEPRPPSYQLAVNGVAAAMTTANQRPASARIRIPKPGKVSSPSRPKSAGAARSPKQKGSAAAGSSGASQSGQFKLPFPDELGVPYHVKRMQEKIFSKELTSQSDDGERPEPQGCATVESAACPKGSSHKSRSEPKTSLVLLQEIEAEVRQSEQVIEEATLMAVQSALQTAAGVSDDTSGQNAEGAQEAEQSSEEPGEEPNPDHDQADVDKVDEKGEHEATQEEQSEQGEDAPVDEGDMMEDPEQAADEAGAGEAEEDAPVDEGDMMEDTEQAADEAGAGEAEEDAPVDEGDMMEDPEQAADEAGAGEAEEDAPVDEGDMMEDTEQAADEAGAGEAEEDAPVDEGDMMEDTEQAADEAGAGEAEEEETNEGNNGDEDDKEPEQEEKEEDAGEDDDQAPEETPGMEPEDGQQAEDTPIENEENIEDVEITETTAEEKEEEDTEANADDGEGSAEPAEEQAPRSEPPEEPAQLESSEDNQVFWDSADAEQKTQNAELDAEDLQRSEKHVSFCEELATVYEPGSVEGLSSVEGESGFAEESTDAAEW